MKPTCRDASYSTIHVIINFLPCKARWRNENIQSSVGLDCCCRFQVISIQQCLRNNDSTNVFVLLALACTCSEVHTTASQGSAYSQLTAAAYYLFGLILRQQAQGIVIQEQCKIRGLLCQALSTPPTVQDTQ